MRDTAEEVAFLRRNPIFAPLPATTLDLLARNAVPHVVDADDLIIREGDRGDRFFMIERGEVEVTQDGSAISRLGEGASFGEIALLDDVPRTATVRAVVQTRLLTLDREDFLLALSGHPDAGHEARSVAQERSDRRPEDRPTP
jgi:CRP-like cAMP-binding protein